MRSDVIKKEYDSKLLDQQQQQQQQQQQTLTHELGTKRERPAFWNDATKYVEGRGRDGPFVEEIAYIMVTLHRTGA